MTRRVALTAAAGHLLGLAHQKGLDQTARGLHPGFPIHGDRAFCRDATA